MLISYWSSDVCSSDLEPSFTPTGKLSASYGRFDDKRAQFYFSSGLSETLAFDIAGLYRDSDGWIRDIDGFDSNPQGARTLRGKLLFTPNDQLKLIGSLSYDRAEDATGLAITPVGRVLARSINPATPRSEEHTSELQSLMRNSYAVVCLKKKKKT